MENFKENFYYFVESIYYRDKSDAYIRSDVMIALCILFFPLWIIYKFILKNNGRKYS